VEHLWRLASFSALLGGHGGDSLPDRDPVLAPARVGEPLPPGLGPASFPRGAGPGSCLHALLETWDFARGERSELDAVAEQCLASYGIDGVWREPLVEWMGRVVATPLDPAGWALRDLPRSRRVHELEFHYPVLGLEAQALAERLRRLGGPELAAAAQRLGALGFSLSAGFLRGFVDLIFEQDGLYYVADFKSNWLGPSVEDYRPERLAQSMDEEGYHLQHLLYLLALHRFLRIRLADYDYRRHVGGVLYLYLRGMDPESGAARGVYRVRPAAALVEALDQWLSSP
jgi:exodeoxyribonuclease V beta subunit